MIFPEDCSENMDPNNTKKKKKCVHLKQCFKILEAKTDRGRKRQIQITVEDLAPLSGSDEAHKPKQTKKNQKTYRSFEQYC